MNKQYTKYRVQFQAENEVVRRALELVIKKDKEYGTRREANEVRRHIAGLFPEVRVEVLSVCRVTRIKRLNYEL